MEEISIWTVMQVNVWFRRRFLGGCKSVLVLRGHLLKDSQDVQCLGGKFPKLYVYFMCVYTYICEEKEKKLKTL